MAKETGEFQEKYKSFDDSKLLKIVEEAYKYQPKAVDAAKLELSKREVSDDEIQAVKDELLRKKNDAESRKKQFKNAENKVKEIGKEVYETINPVQKEPKTTKRKINWVVIIFGFLAIYQIFTEFEMIRFMLTDSRSEWDFSTVQYLLPIALLPNRDFAFVAKK